MKKSFHRPLAILLAVCMMISVTQSFAFAQETEEVTDTIVSVSEGGTPSLNAPVCTCDPAPGTSGVEGHGEDCPLYVKPAEPETKCVCTALCAEGAANADCPVCGLGFESCGFTPPVPETKCVCTALCAGGAANADCPVCGLGFENCGFTPPAPETKCLCTVLCTAEAANADCPVCGLGFERCGYVAPAPTEATLAVYALIDALPSLEEIEAAFTLDSGTPPDMEKLQADAENARAAYDALTDEEKAAFDDLRLQKLEAIEGLFMLSLMAAPVETQPNGAGTQADPWQVGSQENWAWLAENWDMNHFWRITQDFTITFDTAITVRYPGSNGATVYGDGHEITVKVPAGVHQSTNKRLALFDSAKGLIIHNLGLNLQIENPTTNDPKIKFTIGGFAGSLQGLTLNNCYVRGSVGGDFDAAGAIIGTALYQNASVSLNNCVVAVNPMQEVAYKPTGSSTATAKASFAITSNMPSKAVVIDNLWHPSGMALYAVQSSSNAANNELVTTAPGATAYDINDMTACVESMNAWVGTKKDQTLHTWEIKDGHLAFGEKWKPVLKLDTGTATMSGRTATFPGFAVASPSGTDVKSVSVQLAAGRQAGDTLALPSPAAGFAVKTENEGAKLTLTATGQTDAAWTAELKKLTVTLGAGDGARDIRFECSSSTATATGDAVFNKQNGHYYKLASANDWAAAKSAANSSILKLGSDWKGYLATITTADEWSFVQNTFGGARAFVGGSSDADDIKPIISSITSNGDVYDNSYSYAACAQGKFHWISGPEKGMRFWQQSAPRPRFSSSGIPGGASGGKYSAFATGEPNNYYAVNEGKPETGDKWVIKEDERYLAIGPSGWADVSADGSDGTWADGSNINVNHCIIEFGGMDAGELPPVAESFKAVSATITPGGMNVTPPAPDPEPEKPTVTPDPPAPDPAPEVDNANHLTGIYATAGGTTYSVTPTFDHTLRVYSMIVPVGTASVTPGATYTGAGTVSAPASVTLNGEETTFTVTFTANSKNYAYTVTVLASAEAGNAAGDPPADLTNLAVSEVIVGYSFAPATYSYPGIVVKKAATSVNITPAFSGSTVTVNGTTATSGTAVPVPLNDSGATTVLVNVSGGGALSKAYNLTITKNTAVTVAATPTHATSYPGTDGKITITASGGQGNYKYSLNGGTEQTGNEFTGLAAGTYTVKAWDAADATNFASTSVTVKQPAATPSITPGANQTPTYGTEATVSVTANAADNGALTYQWSKSGEAITGATSASYTAPAGLGAGQHSYTCEVTNTKAGTTNGSDKATSAAITVTVSKATPAVTLVADSTAVTYGTPVTLTSTVATAGGGMPPNGMVTFKDGDKVLGTVALKSSVATYIYSIPVIHGALTASYSGNDNYNTQNATAPAVTVTPKPLTVTAVGKTITYGDAAPAYAATYSAFAYTEDETALSGTLAFTCAYTKFDNVNGYDITPSGLTSDNYAIAFAKGTLTVTQKEIGLTWQGTATRTYDGKPSNVTATATGTVNGDKVAVTVSGGDKSDAGTHTATATGLTNGNSALRAFFGAIDKSGNYKLPSTVTQSYTIAKAPVTFVVTENEHNYDNTAKTATVTQTAGETPPIASGKFTVSYEKNGIDVPSPTTVDTYDVMVTLTDDNFKHRESTNDKFKVGMLTISGIKYPDADTMTWPTAETITYGETLNDSTLTGGDQTAKGSYAWETTSTIPTVANSGYTVVFTPTDTNYEPVEHTVSITVTKAPLTPSMNSVAGKEYDGSTTATGTIKLDGAVLSEAPAASGTFAFTSKDAGKNKHVNATGIALTGTWGDNYDLSAETLLDIATTAEITPKEAWLTWSGHTGLVYSDSAVNVISTVNNLEGKDACTVTVTGGDKTNAGAYVAAATAVSNPNYKLPSTVTQSYTIAKAPVTFVVTENEHNYDNTAKTATVTQTMGETPRIAPGKFTVSYEKDGAPVTDPTSVGIYNVLAELTDSNFKHKDKDDSAVKIQVGLLTINGIKYPDAGTMTWPTSDALTYGKKLSDSTLTGGDQTAKGSYAWKSPADIPTVQNEGYWVVFRPNDGNYSTVEKLIPIEVSKVTPTLALPTAAGITYGKTLAESTLSGGSASAPYNGVADANVPGVYRWTAPTTKPAVADSNSTEYALTFTPTDTDNYYVVSTSKIKLTVTAANPTLSGTASYTKLLTDADFALDVKTDSTDTDAAVVYTLTDNGGGAVTLDADGKTVRLHKTGTATITAASAATANFTAAEPKIITVTVGSMPTVRIHAAEGITTTEAKIGGTITGGTIAVTEYGLQYKKSSDTDYAAISPAETDNGDVKTLTYSLVGLEKDTEYSVRIWAKTADKNFESVTRFRTAAEQPPTGSVEGEIKDESGTKTAITVTIEAGNTVIASKAIAAGGGKFTFEALPDGFYNLVADNGRYKVTRMVQVVKGGAVTDVTMTIGKTQSVVEVKGEDTPKVAVDGLPELFGNDKLFTTDNKDVIAAGGTVEFKLTVQQEEKPADADKFDKLEGGKVGCFLDIQVLKTVTDVNGRADAPEQVHDLLGNTITIVIPLTKELQGKESYTVYSVHDGGAAEKIDSEYSAEQNTLTIVTDKFSTYAIAYTEKSGGTGDGSGGSSHDDDNYDFWQKVKDKINSAEDGDTVKAGAGGYDKMPESVMDALRKNPGVTLEITWRGGDKITIPAGKAQERDGLRIYYPLSYLEELYRDILPDANRTNPETGGVTEINAPITAAQTPAVTTPKDEGTADTPEQAQTERAAIEAPPAAPEIAPIPAIEAETEATPIHSGTVAVILIVITLAAAGIIGIVLFWKKKHEEEAN